MGWIFPPEVDGIVGGHETLNKAIDVMGSITRKEKITAAILFFTIGLWVTTGITGIDSYSVALIGAALYFVTGVIDWKDAQAGVDWGLIIFFGGALSLGAALLNTGAAAYIITHLIGAMGSNVSTLTIMLLLMVIGVVFTQVMSNIALSAILIPLSSYFGCCSGSACWDLCCACCFCVFAFFYVPNGRSNSCNGIWNWICEYKGDIKGRNTNGCNWNYCNHNSYANHSQTIPMISIL